MVSKRSAHFVMPEIVLIAAVAENLAIGKDLDLPWHLPEDLKRFKQLTIGHPLFMGRVTFDSLIHQFQKPLPKRPHVVISSQKGLSYPFEGVSVYSSIGAALAAFSDASRIFISGGASLYTAMLAQCDRWEITEVHQAPADANVFFPPYRHLIGPLFEEVYSEVHEEFTFKTYQKIGAGLGI